MNKIEVKHISKTLDELPTLADISLTVGENEIVVVLGPSGCGKSTLLNIIAGLLHPDRGRIIIEGEDWTGKSTRVSYMQQKDLLLDWRSILDNVTIPLLLKGMPRKQARAYAANYFEDFGLQGFEDYYPRQLSGMRREPLCALTSSPVIYYCWTAFATLDVAGARCGCGLLDLYQRYKSSFSYNPILKGLALADHLYMGSLRGGDETGNSLG